MKVILLLLLGTSCLGQQRFESFTDLRKQKGTYSSWGLVRYGVTMGDKMGGVFFWDSASTVADDNRKTIGNWIKGRYIKTDPLTMARGVYTVSTLVAGITLITIPHGLPSIPTNVQYSFQFASPLTLGSAWQADGTNIYIKVNNPSLVISGTITVAWLAYVD